MKRVSLKNRLMLGAFLICSFITLSVSFYQLSGLQQQEIDLAEREIDNFEQSALSSLREALWNYDWNMVDIIVSSQINPVLAYINVCDAGGGHCIGTNKLTEEHVLGRIIPITYRFSEQAPLMNIGSVELKANYKSFSKLIDQNLLVILFTNSIWVFGVAISVFLLFHLQVIRRIEQVEEFTRNIDLADVEKLKTLAYEVDARTQDEVDLLAIAVADLIDRVKEEFARRQQLEQQLNQTQKMEALGTLAGGIAHDFNNILAAILGYAQLCLRAAEPGTSMYNRLEQVVSAGKRAKSLVSQILVFSRKAEQYTDKFCLAAVVIEALDLVRASLPEGVVVESSLDESLWIAGDDSQLHQIVMNLATNATHALAGQNGGTLNVSICLKSLDRQQAELLGLSEGGYAKLTFCDDGPGVPEEIQDRIFDPFFTTKKSDEGTGMGLAVVHGITLSHGGRILLDTECTHGTCFALYFPLSDGVLVSDDSVELPLHRGGEHLLLVDDENIILNLGRDMLESLGYRVTTLQSPEDALKYLKSGEKIDLIITDLTMPGMTGVELAEQAKKVWPQLPVILWSGYADLGGHESLINGTIDHLLHKPFTVQGLSQAVHKVLKPE
jgi:signal transduction histidine kinase